MSTLVCFLFEHDQKEQEPQEHSSSLTNHLISKSNSDENDAFMESILLNLYSILFDSAS
jgi:hypothetical protein